MTERIRRTREFVRRKLAESPFFQERPEAGAYRLEHTFRVARIGREIAEKEGLPAENMTLACLLHDVSYCRTFRNPAEAMEHGRASARIARPFLAELGLSADEIHEICYGIAIHVDGLADFPGEKTPFTMTVADADNIDRFGAYRLYESLEYAGFRAMPLPERAAYVSGVLAQLERYLEISFATAAATALWRDRTGFCLDFYRRLRDQLAAGTADGGMPDIPAEETAWTMPGWLGLAGRP